MSQLVGRVLASGRRLVFTPAKRLMNRIDPPVLVLLYHRVARLASDPEQLAVSPERFRAQMRHLKENYRLLRFEEEWSGRERPAVCVTFDDGYADNALEALPILEEAAVPATFFVSTGTVGSPGEFWWHELERLILGSGERPPVFTLAGKGPGKSWKTGSAGERELLYRDLVALMTCADPPRRSGTLEQLRDWAQGGPEVSGLHRPLSVAELKLLAASGLCSIGAHTVHHVQLSALSREAQREEMVNSKRELEGWLGREVSTFSYPYGRRCHYSAESVALCRELGFVKAASNFPGQAHSWSDPLQVPRHLVRDWPVELFAEKLKGFWTR